MTIFPTKQRVSKGFHGVLGSALLATTTLAGGAIFVPSAAQAQTTQGYDIPAGPLAVALNRFAEESNIKLFYDSPLTSGLSSAGLKGSFGVAEALSRLLAGTGLTYRQTGPNAFTLERAPQSAGGAIQLGPVRVEGETGASSGYPTAWPMDASEAEPGYNAVVSRSATKSSAALRDVPQSVAVVTRQVVEDQGGRTLQDVLRNVAGIGMSTGDGQRDQVVIRGFSALGDQFVDGLRDDAWYFRELYNVERVEVIKGPAAVLYGRGSSGGIINRVTKKPGIDVATFSLSAGSWSSFRGEVDVGRRESDTLSWRLTGALEDDDSYRDQGFVRRGGVAPSLLWQPDNQTSVLLQADYLEDHRIGDFGLPAFQGRAVDVDSSTYYGAANARDADYADTRMASVTATVTHRLSSNVELRNVTRYYDYDMQRAQTVALRVDETASTVSLSHSGGTNRNELGIFNQTELTHHFELGGTSHELLYGIEVGWQRKDAVAYGFYSVGTTSLFDPVLPTVDPSNLGPITGNTRTRQTTFAAYAQDQVTLTPTLKALIGVRYDSYGQKTESRLPGQPDLQRTDHTFSPRAGLVWQPSAQQSYYLSVSRSFQPSAEVLNLSTNNAGIKPEQTTNYEVGGKFDLADGRATATFAVFQLRRTGIKTVDLLNPTQLIPIGTQRTRGFEASLAGEILPGLDATLSYAFLDARITRSTATDGGIPVQGKRPVLTPRHSASAWLVQRLNENWSVGLGANYVGKRYASSGNFVTIPDYLTADAMIQWRITEKTQLQLNVRNLFNRDYIVSALGNSPLLLPGAPRNFTVRLRQSF